MRKWRIEKVNGHTMIRRESFDWEDQSLAADWLFQQNEEELQTNKSQRVDLHEEKRASSGTRL